MIRFFPTILLSFFLCFLTYAPADENNTTSGIAVEKIESSSEKSHADTKTEVTETEEELSELEKEALAAEEAELRESGIYEEPIED